MADETRRDMNDVAEDPYGGARGGDGRLLSEYTPEDVMAEGWRIAASYLEGRGYELVDVRWECPAGAAIVARKDDDSPDGTCGGVVVVEVDPRLSFGSDSMPELNVDENRRRRLKTLALLYLAENLDLPCVRADVIALDIVAERTAKVRHLVNAYDFAA